MAITTAQLLVNGSNSAGTSYETASVTIVQGRLNLLSVANAYVGGVAAIPTVTGASQTWTQVVTQIDAANVRRVTIFRSLGVGSSGALTIDFGGQTQLSCYWTVDSFRDIDKSGANGENAIVQSAGATNSGSQSGITVTLSAFANANNAAFGAIRTGLGMAGFAQGSGFSLASNFNGSSAILNTEWKNSSDTTVDWTWTLVSIISVACALEIRASNVNSADGSVLTSTIAKKSGLDRAYIKTWNGRG